ncbi:GNAT family N-acetyltransferase [Streptomyces sp. NPDC002845]
MSRTVSAWVTSGADFLGVTGPFPVDVPWWAEVGQVVERLETALGVPVFVLRLVQNDGGESGRDGHVTYHVEALRRPAAGVLEQGPVDRGLLNGHEELRSPWARADGLRELLGWASGTLAAAGRPVSGPVEQRRTWNLAGLFRLPTERGPVWLKATPHFAADEAAVIAEFARVDPGLVPTVLGSGERRVLMEHIPGEDCWQASPATVEAGVRRFVAAQAALASRWPTGLRDGRDGTLAARVRRLLDGAVPLGITAQERATALELADGWALLAQCGLPDTVVHGDFHPGNWRADCGPPVVVDFADAFWGNPVLDVLRLHDFLPEPVRATAVDAWADAWRTHAPSSDPVRALALAEPLAHLAYAVRYQDFLDGIETSERPYHEGDPATEIRKAVRCAGDPGFATGGRDEVGLRQDQLMDSELPLTFPSPFRLEGHGVRLREWADDDVQAMVAVYDDPEIDRWTPVVSPFDTEAAHAYIAAARQKRAEERAVQLAITTDGQPPLGEVMLFRGAADERDIEIAYGVGPAHRGKGLASKAVRLVTEYAVRHTGARRVVLSIEEGNTASEAVAKATGFELTDDDPVVRTSKGREVVLRIWSHRDGPGPADRTDR